MSQPSIETQGPPAGASAREVSASDNARFTDKAWVEVIHAPAPYEVELSPGLGKAVDQLAAQIRGSREDVILRAIALYGMALDYHQKGKQVGAADEGQPIEVTFDMFEVGSHGG